MLKLAHKQLTVYKAALRLAELIYESTKTFPKEEQFGLINQLRRAAVSVCSNLAEGSARTSSHEKRRFYEVSRSSLVEIDTQIEISINLSYLKKAEIASLENSIESVFKMLSKMISNLK